MATTRGEWRRTAGVTVDATRQARPRTPLPAITAFAVEEVDGATVTTLTGYEPAWTRCWGWSPAGGARRGPRWTRAGSGASRYVTARVEPLYPPDAAAAPASDRVANSSAVSCTPAAAMFSSRWSSEAVPGIGSITGERCSSHASAT